MALPVFKTGLAANDVAGGFDSLPPPPSHKFSKAMSHQFSTVEGTRDATLTRFRSRRRAAAEAGDVEGAGDTGASRAAPADAPGTADMPMPPPSAHRPLPRPWLSRCSMECRSLQTDHILTHRTGRALRAARFATKACRHGPEVRLRADSPEASRPQAEANRCFHRRLPCSQESK